jgi:antitoxin (DNA-binding transcriptional repressor) of toxin-antitoxin stability system
MPIYNIYEAKTSFWRLVEEATSGEEVVIAKAGKPVLRMVPIGEKKEVRRRKFGQNFLEINYIARDFYDDLPLDMFEVLRDVSDDQR